VIFFLAFIFKPEKLNVLIKNEKQPVIELARSTGFFPTRKNLPFMHSKYNASQIKSQTESKQINLFSFQTGVYSKVIASLEFTKHENTLGLLIEDLCNGGESMITQLNLGILVGVGRQRQNEVCMSLKKLGLLDWYLSPTGINVYFLPPIYQNVKILKILRTYLPCLKRSIDKLISRLLTKLSTHEATPIKNKLKLSLSYRKFIKIRELLKGIKETGDIVKETAEVKKQNIPKFTPEEIEKVKKLSESAPKDSVWAKFYATLGF
jgi:hypothetical protein